MQTMAQAGAVRPAADAGSIPSLVVLAAMLTIAIYMELKEKRIPNWLTLPGMASGLLFGYLHGTTAFWFALGGLAIGFGFLFIFYVFGGLGGGDVKLMGAAGALMGADLIKPALVYTAFVGAILAAVMVIWRKDFWVRIDQGMRRLAFWRKKAAEQPMAPPPISVPYGVAIAVGCLLALAARGAG